MRARAIGVVLLLTLAVACERVPDIRFAQPDAAADGGDAAGSDSASDDAASDALDTADAPACHQAGAACQKNKDCCGRNCQDNNGRLACM